MSPIEREKLYTNLENATTPEQRLTILSAAIGRVGDVTFGISGDSVLSALKDMSLSELASLFDNLGTAIDDRFGDTMLGSDLAGLFSGLGEIAAWVDKKEGDESPQSYMPLFLRTPNAAKCRSTEAVSSGESIVCDVSEKNVFWTPAPYSAGQVVTDQSMYITLTCADGWSPQGEYCTSPSIPGVGVKAQVMFDGDTIVSGGERYKLIFKDHFTVENQSAPKPVGDGSHFIDDNDEGCSLATIHCRMGDGLYHAEGGFGDSLTVQVTWSLLDPATFTKPDVSDVELNNLHPFNVNYQDGGDTGATVQELKDRGMPNGMLVTNLPTFETVCEVSQPEQTVDLGTYKVSGITDEGLTESSLKTFDIGLSCTGTQSDYAPIIALSTPLGSITGGDNGTGYMKNQYTGEDAADNVGVAIYELLNDASRIPIPTLNGSNTTLSTTFNLADDPNPVLHFQAGYYRSKSMVMTGKPTPGKFSADITVGMYYP
ncbi:fimbrial protein [Vibrio natriegens]|uniref:fimbrial protein n=1 Tax=Vibrio natriegens TaxID=691 RepID=UPI003556C500